MPLTLVHMPWCMEDGRNCSLHGTTEGAQCPRRSTWWAQGEDREPWLSRQPGLGSSAEAGYPFLESSYLIMEESQSLPPAFGAGLSHPAQGCAYMLPVIGPTFQQNRWAQPLLSWCKPGVTLLMLVLRYHVRSIVGRIDAGPESSVSSLYVWCWLLPHLIAAIKFC